MMEPAWWLNPHHIERIRIMKFYIQRKEGRELETVDEFETRKEAREMQRRLVSCNGSFS